VGKTTLSAGLGLALARAGERTGLLSVDPARRLRSALGLTEMPESGVQVQTVGSRGSLHAALLDPSASLRRWVAEACPDDAARGTLFSNPYFIALADRLADLTDAIGFVRAVEWAEQEEAPSELVLDTAPGRPTIELLARPEKLTEFFDGRMIRWITRLGGLGGAAATWRGGRRVLAGLARLSGTDVLREFGAFLSTVEAALAKMKARLDRARRWLKEPSTSLVIVSSVNDDGASVAHALSLALGALGLTPSLVVLNRVLPETLGSWSPRFADDAPAAAHDFVLYVRNCIRTQARVRARLRADFARVVDIPDAATLDGPARLDGLSALGEPLRAALRAMPRV
jgi:arsenite-transporting ATPase